MKYYQIADTSLLPVYKASSGKSLEVYERNGAYYIKVGDDLSIEDILDAVKLSTGRVINPQDSGLRPSVDFSRFEDLTIDQQISAVNGFDPITEPVEGSTRVYKLSDIDQQTASLLSALSLMDGSGVTFNRDEDAFYLSEKAALEVGSSIKKVEVAVTEDVTNESGEIVGQKTTTKEEFRMQAVPTIDLVENPDLMAKPEEGLSPAINSVDSTKSYKWIGPLAAVAGTTAAIAIGLYLTGVLQKICANSVRNGNTNRVVSALARSGSLARLKISGFKVADMPNDYADGTHFIDCREIFEELCLHPWVRIDGSPNVTPVSDFDCMRSCMEINSSGETFYVYGFNKKNATIYCRTLSSADKRTLSIVDYDPKVRIGGLLDVDI